MRWVRRVAVAVLCLVGVAAAVLGVGGLWLDGRLDDGRELEAVVTLSEGARLDVEIPDGAGEGSFSRAVVWSDGSEYGIGQPITVQIVDSPQGLVRIAGDDRLASYGQLLLIGGVLFVVVVIGAAVLVARRRRGSRPASAHGSVEGQR